MHNLSLAKASTIADTALAEARRLDLKQLTIAVLDSGGHVVLLEREDGSEFLRVDIAIGKAWGALGMGVPSRVLGERAPAAPTFMGALTVASGGRFVPGPGGVLVRNDDGTILGAVGVSGDSGDADEAVAVAGIEEAGLLADYGQREEWRR